MAIPDLALSMGLRDRTAKGADSAAKNMGKIGKAGQAMGKVVKAGALAATAGVAAIGGGIAFAVKDFVEAGKEIRDLAKISQASAERLQVLGKIAERGGGSAEDVADAYREMQLRIAEASELASGPAVDALNLLGLPLEYIKSLDADDQFLAIRNAIASVEDPAQKLFVAEELLGGSSERLQTVLEGDIDAFQKVAAEIRNTGGIMSNEAVNSAGEFSDSLELMKTTLRGVGISVASQLVPHLQTGFEYVRTNVIPVIQEVVKWAQQHLEKAFKDLSRIVINDVVPAAQELWARFNDDVLPVLQELTNFLQDAFIATWQNDLQPALEATTEFLNQHVWPAIERVHKALTDWWENSIKPVIQRIAEWTGKLEGVDTALKAAAIAVGVIAIAVGAFSLATTIATAAVGALTAAMAILFAPVTLIIGAIALVTAGVVLLYKNWQPFRDFVDNKLVPSLKWLWEGIQRIWKEIPTLKKRVVDGFQEMWRGLKGVINTMIGGIEAIPNAFISGLNSMIRAWNNFSIRSPAVRVLGKTVVPSIRFNTPNIATVAPVNIPRLARGGYVTHPTLAVIGERGPEEVVPLDQAPRMGGPQVYVDARGATFYGLDDFDERVQRVVNRGLRYGAITA